MKKTTREMNCSEMARMHAELDAIQFTQEDAEHIDMLSRELESIEITAEDAEHLNELANSMDAPDIVIKRYFKADDHKPKKQTTHHLFEQTEIRPHAGNKNTDESNTRKMP